MISNGVPGPTPTPTTGAPTTATPAAPTAPTSGTPGIPEYVEVAAGLAIDSSQADGAGLVVRVWFGFGLVWSDLVWFDLV